MKTNILIIILLLFLSCRKDSFVADNNPATSIATEVWKMLDENTIYLFDRNILSVSATNNKLFIQTPYSFQVLDSNLKRYNSTSASGPRFDNGFNKVVIGNNFRLFFDNPIPNYLEIADNNDFSNRFYAEISLRDSTNTNYFYSKFSNFDNNDNFCLGYYIGFNNGKDTATYYVKKFHASRVPMNDLVCSEVFNKQITKQVYPYGDNGTLYLFNDIIYYSYFGLGFRFEYPNKIDTLKFNLVKMIKINNTIYATCKWASYNTEISENGLFGSNDNGVSWQRVATNGFFTSAKDLVNIDNKLLMYQYNWIYYFDITNNTFKQIDTKQIHAQIKTVTHFRDKVIVGTDAGIYYKSVKHFFED